MITYFQISAIVYLADGNECRCLQVPPYGTVADIVHAMLMLHAEWDELGADAGSSGTRTTPDGELD